jgi:DNA-binding ferritin-like protein (Dps family)
MKKLFGLIKIKEKKTKLREEKRTELLNIKRKLIDFGIKNLEFEIERKSIHRVFNRGSLEFDKGGRNYGAFYQGLHEDVRSCIHINGNKTTEVDFSGMHIRMLYHQLNLDYRIDPYAIGTKEERTKYKFVSLISINAAKKEAAAAIKKLLRKHNIDYGSGKGCINKLIENYKEFHEPIKEYLFTSAGIDLQNTDSLIMEEILMELHQRGILGLPIHDSVIVEAQHEGLLKDLMMQAYRKFMDFEPVLKVA